MALFVTNGTQTVQANNNVPFAGTSSAKCMFHSNNSGIVTLKGVTKQCYAKFRVTFSGNLGLVPDGTPASISLALALNGEAVDGTIMTVTPAAVDRIFNVSTTTEITVPQDCCLQLSLKNVSTQAVTASGTLVVTRIA